MATTFGTFKTTLKAVVFPKGEAENLVTVHNTYILDALIEIQKYVKCFRAENINIIPFCSTYYKCGLTVTAAPEGLIRRVYSVDADNSCCKIEYRRTSRADVEARAAISKAELGPWTEPDQTDAPDLPIGFKWPHETADSDLGRAIMGWYGIESSKLYVWPWLQSTENLVVEFEGVKTSYTDGENVYNDSPELYRAVRSYLNREVARNETCDDNKLIKFNQTFQDDLGYLMWWCRQQLEGAQPPVGPTIVGVCSATEEGEEEE